MSVQPKAPTNIPEPGRVRRWIALVIALVLLNASLTFRNVWPTPAITWRGDLSIEVALCVLALALAVGRFGAPRGWTLRMLAAVWVVLAIGRYADVTAPAMYGREINLYWDVRHMGAVVSMMGTALPPWLAGAVVLAAAAVVVIGYRLFRWALGALVAALQRRGERMVLGGLAAALAGLYVAGLSDASPPLPRFATPVAESYLRQVRLFATAAPASIPAARPLESSLANVAGADVLVLFIESYGAVTYDNAAFRDGLAATRAALQADIDDTGRRVVSAFVESPTFGGSSWLAHVSLLTGVEVRNEDTNVRVMSQRQRDTLVSTFARAGYRTVAAMPGNSHPWPEGGFYRYDEIYDRAALDYRGPRFGWWPVPDQFTLARVDALEIAPQPRRPVFLVMPTISTHAPFGPVAPYQPDWSRMLADAPYADDEVTHALAQQPDLLNLGPSYVNAVGYTLTSIGGYLRQRADRDIVLIVIGDHQPAAMVSGEGAPWDVPVHVIASRPALLERLEAHGFRPGLDPARVTLGPMHTLVPVLLDAFGQPAGD